MTHRPRTNTQLLELAIKHLTANQYRAIELRILGHTYAEIGLELDITRQAATSRVRSAEHRLTRILAHRKEAA